MKLLNNILSFTVGISTVIVPIGLSLENTKNIPLESSQIFDVKSDESLTITEMISQPLQEEIHYELKDLDSGFNYFITVYNDDSPLPIPIIFHEAATGNLTIKNLDPTVAYQDYTINLIAQASGSPSQSIKDIVVIPDFQVLEEQHIDDLTINQTETKSDGVHVFYSIKTNIVSNELMVQVLGEDDIILVSETEDKLQGEILIPLNSTRATNSQEYTLKVIDQSFPKINQQTTFSIEANEATNILLWVSIAVITFFLLIIILVSTYLVLNKKKNQINI